MSCANQKADLIANEKTISLLEYELPMIREAYEAGWYRGMDTKGLETGWETFWKHRSLGTESKA